MHTQLEAIGEQAEDYKQMQDTFHISQYEFTQLRDTISQYKLKIEIWSKRSGRMVANQRRNCRPQTTNCQ